MSEASPTPLLEDLALGGVSAVPANRFEEVALECDARARATGDARYPVLQQVLIETFQWWDERGGIPRAVADQVDRIIREQLPAVLASESPPEAYALATNLAEGLRGLMTGTDDWIDQGYVSPPPDDPPSQGD